MTEGKEQRFHERPLRWVASPLEDEEAHSTSSKINVYSRTTNDHENQKKTSDLLSRSQRIVEGKRNLKLRKKHDSAPSELFYDLFFIANLSSFTSVHKIATSQQLSSYVGFLTLIWGTWFQVSLFDIRLSRDSVIDRCAKAIQFGVMLGFAVVGLGFNPSSDGEDSEFSTVYAQPLSVILMASRFALAFQYGLTAWHARQVPAIMHPSLLLSLGYLTTGGIYLGVSFVFTKKYTSTFWAYAAWYIVEAFETLGNVACSCIWTRLNYKDTYLVQRMGILTLIMLGEGVVGLLKSVTVAWGSGFYYESFISAVICATLIIYFIYQLYFDNIPITHFGTFREQLWALLHLPLHTAIILCVEGSRLFVVWLVALQSEDGVADILNGCDIVLALYDTIVDDFVGATNSTSYFISQTSCLSNITNYVLAQWSAGIKNNTQSIINMALAQIDNGVNEPAETVYTATEQVVVQLYAVIFRAYDIQPPEPPDTATQRNLEAELLAFPRLYDLVLVYFFVAAGCMLLVLGFMIWLSESKKTTRRFAPPSSAMPSSSSSHDSNGASDDTKTSATATTEWTPSNVFRISGFVVGGLGLALLALMDLSARHQGGAGETFLESYWVLPTVTLTLFAVLLCCHIPAGKWWADRKKRRKDGREERGRDDGKEG